MKCVGFFLFGERLGASKAARDFSIVGVAGLLAVSVLTLLFGACSKPASKEEKIAKVTEPERQPIPDLDPISALKYLEQQREGLPKQFASGVGRNYFTDGQYIGVLLERASMLGKPRDYIEAISVSEKSVADFPKSSAAWLARAQVLSTIHLFDKAKRALDSAEKLGARKKKVMSGRATIALALDNFDEALKIRSKEVAEDGSGIALAQEAIVLSKLGRSELADATFAKAIDRYAGSSPFGIAWIVFQRGFAQESAGNFNRARELYREVYKRLPQYAQNAGHLAGILDQEGHREEAVAILEKLIATSDDPEFIGQLGGLLADEKRADELIGKASKEYEYLLVKAPEAFADHAARFWLGPGKNAELAKKWAAFNLSNRDTSSARVLALDAARAAKTAEKDLCEMAVRLSSESGLDTEVYFTAAKLIRPCDTKKADELLGIAAAQ